jgi:hypothetical protein
VDVLEARPGAGRPGAQRVGGSGSDSIASSHAKLRDGGRVARWPRLMIQPSASSGQTSCRRSVMKSVNWPIVRLPAIASRRRREHRGDPERREEDEPGQEARLDRGLAHRLVADALGALGKRSRTSSSRPNACTISIPTTPRPTPR